LLLHASHTYTRTLFFILRRVSSLFSIRNDLSIRDTLENSLHRIQHSML